MYTATEKSWKSSLCRYLSRSIISLLLLSLYLGTLGLNVFAQSDNLPILNGPQTYSQCPASASQDTLTVTNAQGFHLKGSVKVGYVVDGGIGPIKEYSIDQDNDLSLQVEYPAVSMWPPSDISTPPGARTVRVESSIGVFKDNVSVTTLNKSWDVVCSTTRTNLPFLVTPPTYPLCQQILNS